jgi:hypothetical protein
MSESDVALMAYLSIPLIVGLGFVLYVHVTDTRRRHRPLKPRHS